MPRNKGDLKKTGHIANPTGGPRFFRMEKNAVVFCSPCCLFEAAWLVIQQISIYIFSLVTIPLPWGTMTYSPPTSYGRWQLRNFWIISIQRIYLGITTKTHSHETNRQFAPARLHRERKLIFRWHVLVQAVSFRDGLYPMKRPWNYKVGPHDRYIHGEMAEYKLGDWGYWDGMSMVLSNWVITPI